MKTSHFTVPIAVARARAQFEQWLASARPEMIARATLRDLMQRYRCDPKYLECRLLARQDQIRREAVKNPI